MKFTEWIQAHRRSILFLMAIMALAGLVSSFSLPVALFPRPTFPASKSAWTQAIGPPNAWPSRSPTRWRRPSAPFPACCDIRSTTSRGSADISVNFEWGQDMVAAMLQVESAINQVRAHAARRHRLPGAAHGPHGLPGARPTA